MKDQFFRYLVLTQIVLTGCATKLPAFSDSDRAKNPIISELLNQNVIDDRGDFYKKNRSLIEKRLLRLQNQSPSLKSGPAKSIENGQQFWWEALWLEDFRISFENKRPSESWSCLAALSRPADFPPGDCQILISNMQQNWSPSDWDAIHRQTTFRSTFYARYMKSLEDEVQLFDEAYRMQFTK